MKEANISPRIGPHGLIGIILCLLALLPYAQVWNHSFINCDDTQYITENPHVFSGLSLKNIVWAFSTGYASNWHPLTWLSHMLDVSLFGQGPRASHAVNLMFHLANTLLLYRFLSGITGCLFRSALVAALFAVHPLHVESVAWAAERKDLLSTFWGLLAMIAYVRYVRQRRADRYALVCIFFLLSLASKPMLVTLPFVLLLIDYWPLQRTEAVTMETGPAGRKFRALLLEKSPLLALSLASSGITWLVQQAGGAMETLEFTPLSLRMANAVISYGAYLRKTVLPLDLAILYPYPSFIPWFPLAASATLLAAVSLFCLFHFKRRPYLFVGWFWYLGTLVPVIGLVQVGAQSMADRYTYFPLIGIFLMATWGGAEFGSWNSHRRIRPLYFALFAVAVFAALAYRQTGFWKNSVSVWERAVAVTSGNFIAYNRLGLAYIEQGRPEEAIESYRQAIKIRPDYTDGHNHLGTALASLGRLEEAILHYRKALQINPNHSQAHGNLGVALAARDQMEEAVHHFQESLRLKPDSEEVRCNYGYALESHGKVEEAVRQYEESLKLNPNSKKVHNHLALIWAGRGQPDRAENHFRELLRIDPSNAEAWNNWGTMLARLGNLTKAEHCYREAVRVKPDFTPARRNLEKLQTLRQQER